MCWWCVSARVCASENNRKTMRMKIVVTRQTVLSEANSVNDASWKLHQWQVVVFFVCNDAAVAWFTSFFLASTTNRVGVAWVNFGGQTNVWSKMESQKQNIRSLGVFCSFNKHCRMMVMVMMMANTRQIWRGANENGMLMFEVIRTLQSDWQLTPILTYWNVFHFLY